MTPEDLRAAVQGGIVTEAQAASLSALAQARAGQRAALPAEDEPFEFFRGFSEIFISVGMIILLVGVGGVVALGSGFLDEGHTMAIVMPLALAVVAWVCARYFTLRRRMNLPSMVLALAFGAGLWLGVLSLMIQTDAPARTALVVPGLIAVLGMALWYRVFRLPFSMLVLGLFALCTLYTITAPDSFFLDVMLENGSGLDVFFDLRESPVFALATLAFGVCAFVAGMWFDLRDPHRLGRYSATAFWLHLMAAPALVNTVALTIYNRGGGQAMLWLSLALLVITLLALVIDRRSFLTAAISYIAVVVYWVAGGAEGGMFTWTWILILLGALITATGTWWVQLRSIVMRLAPDFPGKHCLPPYSRPPEFRPE